MIDLGIASTKFLAYKSFLNDVGLGSQEIKEYLKNPKIG